MNKQSPTGWYWRGGKSKWIVFPISDELSCGGWFVIWLGFVYIHRGPGWRQGGQA